MSAPVERPSGRRALAALLTLVFLAFYVWTVITIGDLLPNHWLIDLALYGGMGLVWGVPLIPLYSWAERGKRK